MFNHHYLMLIAIPILAHSLFQFNSNTMPIKLITQAVKRLPLFLEYVQVPLVVCIGEKTTKLQGQVAQIVIPIEQ